MSEKKDEKILKADSRDLLSIVKEALLGIEDTSVEVDGQILWVSNSLEGFKLPIDCRSIGSFGVVISPYRERCLKIDFSAESLVIVTPNDFVFDVTQEGFVRVSNVPPLCSVRELLSGFENYSNNPEPSGNPYADRGNYFFQRALIESALIKGLDVEAVARRLNALIAGTRTEEHIRALPKSGEATLRDFMCFARKLIIPDFNEDFIRCWNQYFCLKPWDFYFGLTNELPGSVVAVRLGPDGAGAFGVIVHAGEMQVGDFRIEFNIPNHSAELNHMDGNDEVEAILPRFMENLSKSCLSLGIDELRGHFGGAGSYLGAKAGFAPSQADWFRLRQQLRKRVEELKLSDNDRQTVLRILESDDPAAIQEIANLDLPYTEGTDQD